MTHATQLEYTKLNYVYEEPHRCWSTLRLYECVCSVHAHRRKYKAYPEVRPVTVSHVVNTEYVIFTTSYVLKKLVFDCYDVASYHQVHTFGKVM